MDSSPGIDPIEKALLKQRLAFPPPKTYATVSLTGVRLGNIF
jgi:hypothetical protein